MALVFELAHVYNEEEGKKEEPPEKREGKEKLVEKTR